MLLADRHDFTAIKQGYNIIEPVGFFQDRTHQHCRTAVCCCSGQPIKLLRRCLLECGLQHQVFCRIADQLLFGKEDQVRLPSLRPPFEHGIGVGFQVAHALVELGHGNRQHFGHGACLWTGPALGKRRSIRSKQSHQKVAYDPTGNEGEGSGNAQADKGIGH